MVQILVVQVEFGYVLVLVGGFGKIYGCVYSFFVGLFGFIVEVFDIVYFFGFCWYKCFGQVIIVVYIFEDWNDWQVVFCCKFKVVLIVGRVGENCVGVIVYQDEVCDLYWQFLIWVQWVFDVDIGIYVQFFCGFDCFFGGVVFVVFGDEFCDLWIGSFKCFGNWMIR